MIIYRYLSPAHLARSESGLFGLSAGREDDDAILAVVVATGRVVIDVRPCVAMELLRASGNGGQAEHRYDKKDAGKGRFQWRCSHGSS